MTATLLHGDCLEQLRTLPDNSVDAVVTDPPYGLAFMGKRWDYDVPSVDVWAECLRVLKPGGHLLAFAGTRTQHRMAVRIEDAGFEIRDMIAWVYGSGFPKSLDVSKAIDKAAGAEREVVGKYRAAVQSGVTGGLNGSKADSDGVTWATITTPATDAAKQWDGWGTALKPALEPITVARKPLVGTVAENVQQHGTGALNVDGCRVEGKPRTTHADGNYTGNSSASAIFPMANIKTTEPSGRWPANLIHDGSEEVTALFPDGAPARLERTGRRGGSNWHGRESLGTPDAIGTWPADNGGSAARFFYCAKASKADRNSGDSSNMHATVKPETLMRYLCRLVTPPGGVVLDPFMGSGSTGKAAILEGFRFIGCEREAEYVEIARARIAAAENERAQELPFGPACEQESPTRES